MTDIQLRQYHDLREAGKTHWEALGAIYDAVDP